MSYNFRHVNLVEQRKEKSLIEKGLLEGLFTG